MFALRKFVILGVVVVSVPAHSEEFRIAKAADVVKLSQFEDFAPLMDNLPMRIKNNGKVLKFKELSFNYEAPKDKDTVLFQPSSTKFFAGVNPAEAPQRNFEFSDQFSMGNGTYHCAPTSAAMLLQFYAKNGFGDLAIQANKTADYIHGLAYEMDTNGINANYKTLRVNGEETANIYGHYATYSDDIAGAVNNFIILKNRKLAADVVRFGYKENVLKNILRANRPALVNLGKKGETIGHMVVAIGFETDDKGKVTQLIVRDPAKGDEESKIVAPLATELNDVNSLKIVGGTRYNPYGDVSIADPDAFSPMYAEIFDVQVRPVPEPMSVLGLGFGLFGLLRSRRPSSK